MSTRKEKASEARSSRRSAADPKLSITNRNAAGIDVHSREHWVCVPVGSVGKSPPAERAGNIPPNVRSFGTCTADLERLADWLSDCKITKKSKGSGLNGTSILSANVACVWDLRSDRCVALGLGPCNRGDAPTTAPLRRAPFTCRTWAVFCFFAGSVVHLLGIGPGEPGWPYSAPSSNCSRACWRGTRRMGY